MRRCDAVIIGAGQAGLAMSHCLGRRGIEHVVLERGRVGQRWRAERRDTLRLLTPNWMTRLPGFAYRGADPDGYMAMPDVVALLAGYAAAAPVREGVAVRSLERDGDGYRLATTDGSWTARAVVLATGYCDRPAVPGLARRLPSDVLQLTPATYRSPELLPEGGVLVVGAGASGVQIAEEIQRSGRPVTLSAGRHTRLPRRYRGRDVLWWLDRAGILAEPAERLAEPARRQPSFQLVGRHAPGIDLGSLHAQGVRVTGRLEDADGARLRFRDDLDANVAAAQRRLERVLDRVDAVAGLDAPVDPEARRPLALPPPPAAIDLRAEAIRTVVWAVGYRRAYDWLRVPVLDAAGEIVHRGGVTPAPGLYVLGLPLLRRRNSTFIDGVGADAEELAVHLHDHLAARAAA